MMLSHWTQINRADKPLSTSAEWGFILVSVLSILALSLSSSSYSSSHFCSCFFPILHILLLCSFFAPKQFFLSSFSHHLSPISYHAPVFPPVFSPHYSACVVAIFLHVELLKVILVLEMGGGGWCGYIHPQLWITAGWRRFGLMIRMGMCKARNGKDGARPNFMWPLSASWWGHTVLVFIPTVHNVPLWLHQCMLLPFVFY